MSKRFPKNRSSVFFTEPKPDFLPMRPAYSITVASISSLFNLVDLNLQRYCSYIIVILMVILSKHAFFMHP